MHGEGGALQGVRRIIAHLLYHRAPSALEVMPKDVRAERGWMGRQGKDASLLGLASFGFWLLALGPALSQRVSVEGVFSIQSFWAHQEKHKDEVAWMLKPE